MTLPLRMSFADGRLVIDEDGMTSVPGIFAAGDVAGGPATVVHAIGTAHRVARSIRRDESRRP